MITLTLWTMRKTCPVRPDFLLRCERCQHSVNPVPCADFHTTYRKRVSVAGQHRNTTRTQCGHTWSVARTKHVARLQRFAANTATCYTSFVAHTTCTACSLTT